MRQFFFDILNNLYKMAGLRQLEKIYEEFPDKKDHIREINALLDELCKVCGMFSYIPEIDIQNIIRDKIYSDPKFIGLNGKILFNWFDSVKGPYFARSIEQVKIPEDYKPLTGEAREKMIDLFLKSVMAIAPPEKAEFKGTQLRNSLPAVPETENKYYYQPPSLEEIEARERHTAWIRANFNYLTGEKNDDFVPEKEWISKNYKL